MATQKIDGVYISANKTRRKRFAGLERPLQESNWHHMTCLLLSDFILGYQNLVRYKYICNLCFIPENNMNKMLNKIRSEDIFSWLTCFQTNLENPFVGPDDVPAVHRLSDRLLPMETGRQRKNHLRHRGGTWWFWQRFGKCQHQICNKPSFSMTQRFPPGLQWEHVKTIKTYFEGSTCTKNAYNQYNHSETGYFWLLYPNSCWL